MSCASQAHQTQGSGPVNLGQKPEATFSASITPATLCASRAVPALSCHTSGASVLHQIGEKTKRRQAAFANRKPLTQRRFFTPAIERLSEISYTSTFIIQGPCFRLPPAYAEEATDLLRK